MKLPKSMSVNNVRDAFENASKAQSAVVFVHVGWSISSQIAKRQYCQLILDYYRARPNGKVLFHFVDCSAPCAAVLESLEGWKGQGAIYGNGELILMKKGRVIDVFNLFDSAPERALNHLTGLCD